MMPRAIDCTSRRSAPEATVKAGTNLVHRVLPPDHAGRGDQHVVGIASQSRGDTVHDLRRVGAALRHPSRRWRSWRSRRQRVPHRSARCSRLTTTLGPAKRLLVNTAAAGAGVIGGDDDEVVGVVLDADVGDVTREAAGKRQRGRLVRHEASG